MSWGDWYIEQPWWLLLIPALALAWWWTRRGTHNGAYHIPVPTWALQEGGVGVRMDQAISMVLWLSMLLGILALAEPKKLLVEEEVDAKGIDIMMSIDLSSSMLSRDFKPDRITVAKDMAKDFVSRRRYDRIGIVPFAGEAFTLSPLSSDHDIIKSSIGQLECGSLKDGTAIGMGLATAVNRLRDSEAASKVVILMTDGVNNSGYIDPQTAVALAKEFDVKVYTIGVGSEGMAPTPHSRNRDGSYIFSMRKVTIDEALLMNIAENTGGLYFRALDANDLQEIYNEIDELEKTDMEVTVLRKEKSFAFHLIFLICTLWFISHVLRYGLLKTWPDHL